MTREQLIQELEKSLQQLKSMKEFNNSKVYHQVDLGFYTEEHKQIEDFSLNFSQENEVIVMDYIVEEVEDFS